MTAVDDTQPSSPRARRSDVVLVLLGDAWLLCGLLFFAWDPWLVVLAATGGFAVDVLTNVARTFGYPGGVAFVVATAMQLPILVGAFGLALLFATIEVSATAAGVGSSWVGLGVFLVVSIVGAVRRFSTDDPYGLQVVAKCNEQFCFEDGRPLVSPLEATLGPVAMSWVLAVVFAVTSCVALFTGLVAQSAVAAAATLVVFGAVRELVRLRWIAKVRADGRSAEDVLLEACRRRGNVVPRAGAKP